MELFKSAAVRLGTAGELLGLLWIHKLWWMIPLGLILLVSSIFVILAQSSAVVPLLYTIF